MALTVLSVLPEAADLDVRILATDIDPNMVAQGHAGVYSEDLLEPAPATLWRKYFDRADERGAWSAGDQLRRLVSFRELGREPGTVGFVSAITQPLLLEGAP